ncbi:MAG: ABC transporter permease [Opitutales bacterium]|nr:ABC transporter permease [Opitutales bacterium]MCH8539389.1 ABC transporter permease [Opitutales bacterium]
MNTEEAKGETIRRQSPWQIQRAVVFGVFNRELANRFGRFSLGYIWAPLEPLLYITVLSVIRTQLASGPIAGIHPVVFFASGVLPFILFQIVQVTSLSCVESNTGLFNYQRVKPADIFAARFLLEVLIILTVALLLFPCLYFFGMEFVLNDFLYLLVVSVLFLMFVAGLGLICTVMGPFWNESKKILPNFIRPFFFISGIFFPLSDIPPEMRERLTWNPLLHALELFRHAAFEGYQVSPEVSLNFLFWSALLSLTTGLVVYRLCRVKIVTSGTIK